MGEKVPVLLNDAILPAGKHELKIEAGSYDLRQGIYFLFGQIGDQSVSKRIISIKQE